jgi:hypothetical protein
MKFIYWNIPTKKRRFRLSQGVLRQVILAVDQECAGAQDRGG